MTAHSAARAREVQVCDVGAVERVFTITNPTYQSPETARTQPCVGPPRIAHRSRESAQHPGSSGHRAPLARRCVPRRLAGDAARDMMATRGTRRPTSTPSRRDDGTDPADA